MLGRWLRFELTYIHLYQLIWPVVQRLVPTASGPWAVPLAVPRARSNALGYVTQQLPCDRLRGLFFLKLTYLGPTCWRSKMIPFLLIWIHMSESGDELGPIFAVHES